MLINITPQDLVTADSHGSVATLTGTDHHGRRVTFGGDARMINEIGEMVFFNDADIDVEIEGWQILLIEAP